MKEFPVKYRKQIYTVTVDDADADRINAVLHNPGPTHLACGKRSSWYTRERHLSYVPAWKNRGFRPAIWVGGKLQYLARWLLGVSDPKKIVDHIDQNPLNNCRSNLRIVGRTENSYNSGKHGWHRDTFSGVRGVYCLKEPARKPWFIRKRFPGGKEVTVFFRTKEEARTARDLWLEDLAMMLQCAFVAYGDTRNEGAK